MLRAVAILGSILTVGGFVDAVYPGQFGTQSRKSGSSTLYNCPALSLWRKRYADIIRCTA